jgi:hypothetical protein
VSVAGRASQIEAVPPASIASSAIHSSCSRVRASAGSATSPSENGDLAGDEDGEGESADGSGQAGVAEGREQEGAEGGELEGGADGCEGDVAGQAEAAVQAAATVRATRRRRLPWSSSRHLRAGRPNHRYAHRGLILPAPQGLIYPV